MKKFFFSLILIFSILLVGVSEAQDVYQHVSSFDGVATSTHFDDTRIGDVSSIINYGLTIGAVVVVALIIIKIIQGAVIKGTFDSIQNQMRGKKIIQNAGLALVIFIFTYAVLSFINPKLTGWTLATDFINIARRNTLSSTGAVCNPSKTYPAGMSLTDMLLLDEGNRNQIYTDTSGKPTIGVGFNLDRDVPSKVKSDLEAAGISKDVASRLVDRRDTKVTITEAQIRKLLENDMASHKQMAIDYAGGKEAFESHDTNIQNILINMTFNMGAGGISSFKNMKIALDAKNYYDMAKEIADSRYCGQVGDRCSRLANLASPTYCEDSQIKLSQSQSLFRNNSGRCEIINAIQPSDLKTIQGDFKLVKDKADKFIAMRDAARADGINLVVKSAYRSDDHQISVCQSVCGQNYCTSGTLCAKACKIGGNGSNHSTGDAIDLDNGCKNGYSNSICINNPVYKWMEKNGKDYGFIQNDKIKSSDAVHYSSTGG